MMDMRVGRIWYFHHPIGFLFFIFKHPQCLVELPYYHSYD